MPCLQAFQLPALFLFVLFVSFVVQFRSFLGIVYYETPTGRLS